MGQVSAVVHHRVGRFAVVVLLCSRFALHSPVHAQSDAGAVRDDEAPAESARDAGASLDGTTSDAGAHVPLSPPTGLRPPSLLSRVEPIYPAEELASGSAPSVALSVSIDAEGVVSDAAVIESAGSAFDEAARNAVLQFRFQAATRDGIPIASRIPLLLSFRAPASAPATLEPAAPLPPVPSEVAPLTAPPATPVTVEVHGKLSAQARLTKSADAVTVVNLEQARRRSADMGEVLARVAGVSVRRYGGLGSEFRLSINGLYDSGVRVFVDGIPIDRVYAMGIANVPVNIVDNVEIYRGVVPLRLGADALGGAINLVRPAKYENTAQASYQIGSFGQHRATLAGRYRHEPSGLVLGLDTFIDRADNDYFVNVEIPDDRGRLSPARVRRFNDGYSAWGAAGEIGVVERPWARKLIARVFTSAYEKQHQNNIVMTVPYGEVHYGARTIGGLLTYENTFAKRYDVEAVASYSHRTTDFVDKGKWVYDWHGNRVRERRVAGELPGGATDQTIWQHGLFGRTMMTARIMPGHSVSASVSPSYATRTGDERIQLDPTARDPLTAERELTKNVAGVAYNLGLGRLKNTPRDPGQRTMENFRFENILFGKQYLYRAHSEEVLPGNVFSKREKDTNHLGAGNSWRLMLIDDWLLTKTSYEYAVRLPDTDEVFGDGVLVLANLELSPEISQNGNQEFQLDLRRTKAGDFWVDLNFFIRDSKNMIVLLGSDLYYTYQNVYGARSMGVEDSVRWTSPGQYVTIDGSFTYTSQRNTSEHGTFIAFKGDRIPNRPYLNTSWGGYLHFENVISKRDAIEPYYQGRFVGNFYRGWESVGLREYKQVIPDQISHTLGLTYSKKIERYRLYGTLDVQNLTDARLYNSFGQQLPGRAYYFKLTGDVW